MAVLLPQRLSFGLSGLYAVQRSNPAPHQNWRSNMVENRVELFAVGTGVVLTAIAALVPFFS
jgi:hypothetical protein